MIAVMAVGFALRLQTMVWEPLYFPDSTEYLHLAKEIRRGEVFKPVFDLEKGFAASRKIPLLYSLILAPLARTEDFEANAAAATLFISMLGFLPLFLAARELWGKKAALFAAAFYAINPFSVHFSGFVLTEPLFGTLLLTLFYLSIVAVKKPSPLLLAALGAVGALLYLTRELGLIYFALAFLAAAFRLVLRGRGRREALAIGAGFMAFVLISLPYWLHIRARTGHWGLTVRMRTGEITGLMGADSSCWLSSLGQKTAGNLADYGKALFEQTTPAAAALIAVGILAAFIGRRKRREKSVAAVWTLAWIAVLVLAYAILTQRFEEPRYLTPLIGLGAILAGNGAAALLPESKKIPQRGAAQWIIALIVTAAVMAGGWTYMRTVFEHSTTSHTNTLFAAGAREVAADIRKSGLIPADAVLISRKPFLPYYVGCGWYYDHATGQPMPETLEGLTHLIASGQAGFLAIDSGQPPELTPFVPGNTPPPGARVIYRRFFPEYGKAVILYKLEEPKPAGS